MKRGERAMFRVPIVEVVVSLIASWWAFVLFSSPGLFNYLPNFFKFIGDISVEYHWGIIFTITVILNWVGIIFRYTKIRKTGLILGAVLFGLLSAAYFLGAHAQGHLSISSGTFAVLSFMCFWGVREVEVRNG